MKRVKTITAIALVTAISLGCTCVFAAERTENTEKTDNTRRNHRFASSVSEETVAERKEAFAATLAEKLEAGEITQEQYDKIATVMESGKFGGISGRKNWKKTDDSEAADNNEAEATDEETRERHQNAFGKFKGMGGRMNGRGNGRNWNQNVKESAE